MGGGGVWGGVGVEGGGGRHLVGEGTGVALATVI